MPSRFFGAEYFGRSCTSRNGKHATTSGVPGSGQMMCQNVLRYIRARVTSA